VRKLERTLFEPAETRGRRPGLVSRGPGDPELLTLRAVRRFKRKVVVHDRLVSAQVLSTPPSAERIDVGKTRRVGWPKHRSTTAVNLAGLGGGWCG